MMDSAVAAPKNKPNKLEQLLQALCTCSLEPLREPARDAAATLCKSVDDLLDPPPLPRAVRTVARKAEAGRALPQPVARKADVPPPPVAEPPDPADHHAAAYSPYPVSLLARAQQTWTEARHAAEHLGDSILRPVPLKTVAPAGADSAPPAPDAVPQTPPTRAASANSPTVDASEPLLVRAQRAWMGALLPDARRLIDVAALPGSLNSCCFEQHAGESFAARAAWRWAACQDVGAPANKCDHHSKCYSYCSARAVPSSTRARALPRWQWAACQDELRLRIIAILIIRSIIIIIGGHLSPELGES